jgi:hypothetical protein
VGKPGVYVGTRTGVRGTTDKQSKRLRNWRFRAAGSDPQYIHTVIAILPRLLATAVETTTGAKWRRTLSFAPTGHGTVPQKSAVFLLLTQRTPRAKCKRPSAMSPMCSSYSGIYRATLPSKTLGSRLEQERVATDDAGIPSQVAKYLHGVGDSTNPIIKLLGGAFGVGIIARIVRGYTFVSRNSRQVHSQPVS